MTLWGTGPVLWTWHPHCGHLFAPAPGARLPVDNPVEAVDDHTGGDLDRQDVIHNPQPLLPSLSELNSL